MEHVTVFRQGTCGAHPRLVIGITSGIFLAVCALALLKGGDWRPIAAVCGATVCISFSLAYMKLEIRGSGFSYRNVLGNHVFEFTEIEDALYETIWVEGGWAPKFSILLKDGIERTTIPIGMFPIQASAQLFTALERKAIPVRVDGSKLVANAMRRIAALRT